MSFSFFSKKNIVPEEPIPEEILNAVKTMNDPQPARAKGNTVDGNEQPRITKTATTPSPFAESGVKNAASNAIAARTPIAKTMTDDVSRPTNKSVQKKHVALFIALGAIVLIAVLAGTYWYVKIRTVSVPQDADQQTSTDQTDVPAPVVLPYSPNNPNYLALNTEEATVDDISKALQEAGERMKSSNLNSPIEFVITDLNNNPLAFSRLAFLTGLKLSPELLQTIDEPFSIFLYNDGGSMRIGFKLSFSSTTEALPLIEKEEAALPGEFHDFLYRDITVPAKVVFKSGSYKGQTIRYVNVDEQKNYSFDYIIKENNWLIGTTKDTLRSMLNKKYGLSEAQ